MPLLDHITLLPADLANIMEKLQQLHHNGPIKIIDTNGSLTIRDHNESFLTEVKREEVVNEDY
jgi:hypothetical protein